MQNLGEKLEIEEIQVWMILSQNFILEHGKGRAHKKSQIIFSDHDRRGRPGRRWTNQLRGVLHHDEICLK